MVVAVFRSSPKESKKIMLESLVLAQIIVSLAANPESESNLPEGEWTLAEQTGLPGGVLAFWDGVGMYLHKDDQNEGSLILQYFEISDQRYDDGVVRDNVPQKFWVPDDLEGFVTSSNVELHQVSAGDAIYYALVESSRLSVDQARALMGNQAIYFSNKAPDGYWSNPGKLKVKAGDGLSFLDSLNIPLDSSKDHDAKADPKRGWFGSLFSSKPAEVKPSTDVYLETVRSVTRGYQSLFSTDIEDLTDVGYADLKQRIYQAGLDAHENPNLEPQISAYFAAHFLVNTGYLTTRFEQDHGTAVQHFEGAGLELARIESIYGYPDDTIQSFINETGATYDSALDLFVMAVITAGLTDPYAQKRRDLADHAASYLQDNMINYPLSTLVSAAKELSGSYIGMARTSEDFLLALAPIGNAMNTLTAKMDWGSRPYHAVREYPLAAEIFDMSLLALCGGGLEEKAAEIYETASFEEVPKPWRADEQSLYHQLRSMHEAVLSDCELLF